MKRDVGPVLALILLTGILGGFAWLTHHPDAEILDRAAEYELLAPWVQKFQDLYLPPGSSSSGSSPGSGGETYDSASDAEPEWADWETVQMPQYRRMWVIPGVEVRAEPSTDSEVVARFDELSQVHRIRDEPPWYEIRWDSQGGWIYLENPPGSDEPAFGREAEPVKALQRTRPDPQALDEALAALENARELPLGGHTLYTDVESARLLETLEKSVDGLAQAYGARTGRPVAQAGGGAIVLFRSERSYRRLQKQSPRLAGRAISGHARGDVITFYAGRSPAWRVRTTLVHELTHLFNRRAIGPALPPWLDEGLADDLAMCDVDADGKIRLSTVGGRLLESGDYREVRGALASLAVLRRAVAERRLPKLETVLFLDWYDFVDPARAHLHYAFSAFWVRYLLDGEDGLYRSVFQDWLRGVSEGASADPELLREALASVAPEGRPARESWKALDAGFRVWLQFHMAGSDPIDQSLNIF